MSRVLKGSWIIVAAVFIAASAILGFVKLPSPVGSVALDSAPGYFLAAYMHPALGGLVGSMGHLASAASAGFPLGMVHLVVALQMFFWCFAFGAIARAINRHWAFLIAGAVATLLNGVVGPWMLVPIGLVSGTMAKGIVPLLTFASALNVAVASIVIIMLSRRRGNDETA